MLTFANSLGIVVNSAMFTKLSELLNVIGGDRFENASSFIDFGLYPV